MHSIFSTEKKVKQKPVLVSIKMWQFIEDINFTAFNKKSGDTGAAALYERKRIP